ncbi:MAG: UDP-N-acetylmuramate dehydrogenase [Gemmatimonadales bacterium]|nr:UDP-N-acetylmuramate dehydrogenase [Gemmatimonadales bacterium]
MTTARDPGFAALVRAAVQGEVREGEALARYSTYRIGGPATVLHPARPEDVGEALRVADRQGVPWFVLGLGSNVLLPDEGLEALVVRLGRGVDRIDQTEDRWRFGAGLPAPIAARKTAQAGWAGVHLMVGVPGTVGGGVYMNAGCHGGQWSDVVEAVVAVDGRGQSRVFARSEIPFEYRRSGLDGYVVLETTVRLRPGDGAELAAEVARLFEWRQKGTPFNQPCCGSVFKNPSGPVVMGPDGRELKTAGQLIEGAGLKGVRIGGAMVSPMHANYFVNAGDATAADVRALIDRARAEVQGRFGVALEPEVKLIGVRGTYLGT